AILRGSPSSQGIPYQGGRTPTCRGCSGSCWQTIRSSSPWNHRSQFPYSFYFSPFIRVLEREGNIHDSLAILAPNFQKSNLFPENVRRAVEVVLDRTDRSRTNEAINNRKLSSRRQLETRMITGRGHVVSFGQRTTRLIRDSRSGSIKQNFGKRR